METGIIASSIVFLLLAGFILVFILFHRSRQRKNFEEKDKMKAQFNQTLLQTQLEIQEQTLKTVSQEIHDNIGQVLSLAKLNLNTMDITKQNELLEKIDDSRNLVSKAIHDLRHLSKSLNTDSIGAMGLVKAIESELEMLSRTGFATQIEIEGRITRMEPQKELILFRIVQETLNNIIKHSEAKRINVIAAFMNNQLQLLVRDDGKGMELDKEEGGPPDSPGLGIRNMYNRAKLIGGEFHISSLPGKGTEIKILIPF